MKIKKQVYLIQVDSNTWYVPRPSSWMAGLARSKWIENHLRHTAKIASPSLWEDLKTQHSLCLLVEYDSGEVEFKEVA